MCELPPTDRPDDWERRLDGLIERSISPDAQRVDLQRQIPSESLLLLAQAGLAGITTPREYGGRALGVVDQWRFHERLAGACGNTWFVLVQHLGACSQIANTANADIRASRLSEMAQGRRWVGVAFGHLRRPDPPVRAEPCPGGWLLRGTAPWVTGWPMLDSFIVGARLDDGKNIFLLVDAQTGPTLRASAPLDLGAMGATGTVAVDFSDHMVSADRWIRTSPPEEMKAGDVANLLRTTAPLLGLAATAITTARLGLKTRPVPAGDTAINALDTERRTLRDTILTALQSTATPEDAHRHCEIRVDAIDLASRCAHAAAVASAGAGNENGHPAQRHVREAVFYSVFQQTSTLAAATLERLSQSHRSQ